MGKQLTIAGTERVVVQEVADQGEILVDCIAAATKALLKRHEAEAMMIEKMKQHKVKEYVNTEATPPVWIQLGKRDTVKVKKWKPPTDKKVDADEDAA